MAELILTDKHLDLLKVGMLPDTRLLTLEGTVRSSKTLIAIQLFYLRVKFSKDKFHCIAGKDYDSIRDNILDCNGFGLTSDKFTDVILKRDKIGSYYLLIRGIDGEEKIVLLAGYDNKAQWKKILGKTISTILIDEVNIADRNFVDECFARQVSVDNPLTIFTLNGDNPDHYIYTDYINYSKPIWVVPNSIVLDMKNYDNKKGYYYTHWTMNDNPVMTKEKIDNAMQLYPIGSYYYTTKILGERGTAEGSIYAQYLNESYISKKIDCEFRGTKMYKDEIEYLLMSGQFIRYTIGLDLGNNDLKRGTILTFTGLERAFSSVDVIDSYQCKEKESQALVEEICNKIAEWYNSILNINAFNSIRVDGYGAIQVLIPTIRKQLASMRINCVCDLAIKFGEDGGRFIRQDLLLLMVSRHMIKFSQRSGAIETMKQLRKLVYNEKDGLPLDNNTLEVDYYDSLGYSYTPFTTELTNVLRR